MGEEEASTVVAGVSGVMQSQLCGLLSVDVVLLLVPRRRGDAATSAVGPLGRPAELTRYDETFHLP